MVKRIIKILIIICYGIGITSLAFSAEPKLRWEASINEVIGYRVYYGVTQDNFPFMIDVGNATECPISIFKLKEGVPYYFVVRSYNNATSESVDSNVIEYIIEYSSSGDDQTPPLPPQNLKIRTQESP